MKKKTKKLGGLSGRIPHLMKITVASKKFDEKKKKLGGLSGRILHLMKITVASKKKKIKFKVSMVVVRLIWV